MAERDKEEVWRLARLVGRDPMIFAHWTAGHYDQPFSDYHLNIGADGTLYTDVASLADRLAHTWKQNTGGIGVSLCCAYNATPDDFGPEPPTTTQIDMLAQVIAVLCQGLDVPCDYAHVRTHAEQADEDGYGPATTCERWDLWLFPGVEKGQGGEAIRAMAGAYLKAARGMRDRPSQENKRRQT